MAKMKAEFDYDPEADSLYIYVPKKGASERVASISAGEYFILDVLIKKDSLLSFKGFEILDASKWMGKSMIINSKVEATPKQILKNIKEVNVETRFTEGCVFLGILINSIVKNKPVEAKQAIPIPLQTR